MPLPPSDSRPSLPATTLNVNNRTRSYLAWLIFHRRSSSIRCSSMSRARADPSGGRFLTEPRLQAVVPINIVLQISCKSIANKSFSTQGLADIQENIPR